MKFTTFYTFFSHSDSYSTRLQRRKLLQLTKFNFEFIFTVSFFFSFFLQTLVHQWRMTCWNRKSSTQPKIYLFISQEYSNSRFVFIFCIFPLKDSQFFPQIQIDLKMFSVSKLLFILMSPLLGHLFSIWVTLLLKSKIDY